MLIHGHESSSAYRRTTIILYVSECFFAVAIVNILLISFAEAIATLDNLDKAINLFS